MENKNQFLALNDMELELAAVNLNEARFIRINNELNAIKRKQEDISIEIDNVKDIVSNSIKTVRAEKEVTVNALHIKERCTKYVGLSRLGECIGIKLSDKAMGHLLRVVGLAKIDTTRTIPMHKYVDKYAVIEVIQDRQGYTRDSYKWHPDNCIEFIDKWLIKNDFYNDFYAAKNENKLHDYIKYLVSISKRNLYPVNDNVFWNMNNYGR